MLPKRVLARSTLLAAVMMQIVACNSEDIANHLPSGALPITNQTPVAYNSTVALEAASIEGMLPGSDPDGDDLTFVVVNGPSKGQVTITDPATGAFTYTPGTDTTGTDEFTFMVSDGTADSEVAVVSVKLSAAPQDPGTTPNPTPDANGAPIAENDAGATNEGTALELGNVLANDSDPDGDSLSITGFSQPANGTVALNATTFAYTPNTGFTGSDSFSYTVSDGNGGEASATVTIQVKSTNGQPVAQDDALTTDEGVAVSLSTELLSNDTDPDGDALTIQSFGEPANGTVAEDNGEWTYTPTSGFSGSDSFSYTIADARGSTATATVTVDVKAAPAPAPKADMNGFFVTMGSTGTVDVTLHPGATVSAGAATRVAFGVPFPRGTVDDVAKIRILDANGQEMPAHVEEITRWQSLSGDTSVDSVRAALVYVDATFATVEPMTVQLEYGVARTKELGAQSGGPESTWVPITQGTYPNEYPSGEGIEEPAVYATLPAEWLGATLMRTRSDALNSDPSLAWFDESYLGFAHTAVNDVSDATKERINYSSNYEPWLFDRAMTLFGLYTRSGDVKWLRHAHRAAQFYANHINSRGYFDLKSTDPKYAYGQSMLVDMLLTGDKRLVTPIENVASLHSGWTETYYLGMNFWTERHQAYSLLGALSAWEATGKAEHAARLQQVVDASINQALQPDGGWAADGCLLHTLNSHEGTGGNTPACSPWMSALVADGMLRYYIHSEDERALRFLADLGDYVKNYALFKASGGEMNGMSMPYYMASSVHHSAADQWNDVYHTCDVAGLVAKGAWAKKTLGEDPSQLVATADKLLVSCEYNLDSMHRPGSDVNFGKAVWRLSPARQFSWWFGTTSDLQWMLNKSR